MPRLNPYQQQTIQQSVTATPDAFGAGVGRAMEQSGRETFDLGVTIQKRANNIDRIQKVNEIDMYGQEALVAAETVDDISRPETITKLQEGMNKKVQELLSQHTGGMESRAALEAQLKNQASQFVKSAMGAQVKAQQQFIANSVEQQVNVLTAKAASAPEMLEDAFSVLDDDINNKFGDVLSPAQSEAYLTAGRSQIVQGTIDTLLQQGQWQRAQEVINKPEVVKYLEPSVMRQARLNIAVDKNKASMEEQRQLNQVKTYASLAGRDLTPVEIERVKALPPKKDMTPADEIASYELITGKPASQYVVDRAFGIVAARGNGRGNGSGGSGGSGGMNFGNSLKGRALNFVTENADAYAAGLLPPQQARMFEAAASQAYAPAQRFDSITGEWTNFTPTMPDYIREALQMGGSNVPTEPSVPPGAVPGQDNTQPGTAVPTAPLQPNESGRTVWERRSNVAGPVAASVAAVNRVPGAGPVVAEAVAGREKVAQIEQDRVFVENASRDLIRTLQNNPRLAEGERKAIEKEIAITPEALRSKESFENKLKGISQALSTRMRDTDRTLMEATISKEERQRLLDTKASMQNFMKTLGVPPTVSTPEEARMLPKGSQFFTPDGRLKVN